MLSRPCGFVFQGNGAKPHLDFKDLGYLFCCVVQLAYFLSEITTLLWELVHVSRSASGYPTPFHQFLTYINNMKVFQTAYH